MAMNGRNIGKGRENEPYNLRDFYDGLGGYAKMFDVEGERKYFTRINPYLLAGIPTPENIGSHMTYTELRADYKPGAWSCTPTGAPKATRRKQPRTRVSSRAATVRGYGC